MQLSLKNRKVQVNILVGARESPLSKAQVEEVEKEVQSNYPYLRFIPIYCKTHGDLDRRTSLRDLDKTDFFTREIDEMLLNGMCRIAIHSAKDLPDPLPSGLKILKLTQGLDPADALVLRDDETLYSLAPGSLIATSSKRREEMVKDLRQDFKFVDIRGYIEERLAKLSQKEIDGVVIAEAALIRLKLTHLNRVLLRGETAPLQGRLAIIGKEGDLEMEKFFSNI